MDQDKLRQMMQNFEKIKDNPAMAAMIKDLATSKEGQSLINQMKKSTED